MPLEAFYGSVEVPLTRSEISFAKRICQACPVLMDCAVFAFNGYESGPDPFGVWAGSTPSERQKILREYEGDRAKSAQYLVKHILTIDGEITNE